MNDKIVNNNHEVKMIDRCILNITGIKKIINFDNKESLKVLWDLFILKAKIWNY